MFYPFSKGKISALDTPKAGNSTGLFKMLGEDDATHPGLIETGQRFFATTYLITRKHVE